MLNPFTPNLFGSDPPVFVGRALEIQECFQTPHSGETRLNPATAIVRHRGSGKTVLLNAIGKEAEYAGWAVISAKIWLGILRELNSEPIDAVLRLYGRRGWDLTDLPELSLEGISEFNGVFENLLAVAKSQGRGLSSSIDDVRPYLLDEFAQIV